MAQIQRGLAGKVFTGVGAEIFALPYARPAFSRRTP